MFVSTLAFLSTNVHVHWFVSLSAYCLLPPLVTASARVALAAHAHRLHATNGGGGSPSLSAPAAGSSARSSRSLDADALLAHFCAHLGCLLALPTALLHFPLYFCLLLTHLRVHSLCFVYILVMCSNSILELNPITADF